MTFFLSSTLAANRKGRFLQSLIGARALDAGALPKRGLLLCTGEELLGQETAESLLNWAMQPDCAVLLLAPLTENNAVLSRLSVALDWELSPVTQVVSSDGLVGLLGAELNYQWLGHVGSADPHLHQANGVVHTRYFRKHSNSGLFAVTSLPVWSISLLDHADSLLDWLAWFVAHSGVITEQEAEITKTVQLADLDYSVLLLAYACPNQGLVEIDAKIGALNLFNLTELDLHRRWPVLQQQGYIKDQSLTEKGEHALRTSVYWRYAEVLAAQIQQGSRV